MMVILQLFSETKLNFMMNKTNPMILLEEHAIDNVQMDTSLIIQIQQIYYVASVKVHVEHVL